MNQEMLNTFLTKEEIDIDDVLSLEEYDILFEELKQNKTVKSFVLGYPSDKYMDVEVITKLVECLKENTSIVSIDLSDRGINDECVKILSNVFKYNTSIKTVNLSLNYITHKGLKMLKESLQGNYTVQKLNISNNKFMKSKEGIYEFIDMIKTINIETLVMDGVNLTDEIVGSFRVNSSMTKVFMYDTNEKYEGIKMYTGRNEYNLEQKYTPLIAKLLC